MTSHVGVSPFEAHPYRWNWKLGRRIVAMLAVVAWVLVGFCRENYPGEIADADWSDLSIDHVRLFQQKRFLRLDPAQFQISDGGLHWDRNFGAAGLPNAIDFDSTQRTRRVWGTSLYLGDRLLANQNSRIQVLRRLLGTPRFEDDSAGVYYEFTREPYQVRCFPSNGGTDTARDFALIRLDLSHQSP